MLVLAYFHFTIYPEQFLILEIIETLKGSYTKFFGTETKKFRRKIVIPLFMNKSFRYPKLVIHWRVPYEVFRHSKAKNF